MDQRGLQDGDTDLAEGRKCFGLSPEAFIGVAVLAGVIVGVAFSEVFGESPAIQVLALPGKLWLKALKCIVLPMIVLAMVDAMVMIRSLPGAKMVAAWVVGLYLMTTVCAATEGSLVSAVILSRVQPVNMTGIGDETPDLIKRSPFEAIMGIFDNLIPSNLVADAGNNNLLPIIVASITFGLLIPELGEDGTKSQSLRMLGELKQIVKRVVTGIMSLTPIGVFSLVFQSAATLDLATLGANLGLLIMAVVLGLGFHMGVVYPAMLVLLARRNPIPYYKNIVPAWCTMIGTSSSAATLPSSLQCAAKNGIAPHTANFVLSLGATINMDGSSLYFICATVFVGRLQGVTFGLGDYITMSLLSTICSMGAAPIPSAGLVLIVTIMDAVGVPFNSSFGVILAVDWLLDRMRGIVNIAGDASVAAVIDYKFGDTSEDSEEASTEMAKGANGANGANGCE